MRQLLEDMLQRQDRFQVEHIAPDWVERCLDWKRAVWTECAELIGHLGWKWWAEDSEDLWQAQLEAVDIACFLFSWVLDEANGDQALAAKRIEHGLKVPAKACAEPRIVVEEFASCVLTFERPCLPHFRSVLDALQLRFDDLYVRYIGKMTLNRFRQDNGYRTGSYTKIWDGKEDNAHLQEAVENLPWPRKCDVNPERLIYGWLETRYRKLVGDAPDALPAVREPSAAELDLYLDSILVASGSSLKNYTLPDTLENMRFVMRNAMLAMGSRGNGKAEAA